jgi:integrase
MKDLNYALKQLCKNHRDGSFATQANRERILELIADQLHEMGFRHMQATSLKPKHVEALVARWQQENLSAGTIKNRMAHLRWWAEKIGKPSVIARGNEDYGIPDRKFVAQQSKAKELVPEQLQRIDDPYTVVSLKLQDEFGLRREESIKMQPGWADRGDMLALKDTWTKGGRAREIPIRTEEQRRVLDEAKRIAGKGSLIPAGKSYIEQLKRFENQCAKAGIHKVHGLRHAYAQRRYQELTGRACPAAGGLHRNELTPEQKATDREARLTISKELGHEREAVTTIYLGR